MYKFNNEDIQKAYGLTAKDETIYLDQASSPDKKLRNSQSKLSVSINKQMLLPSKQSKMESSKSLLRNSNKMFSV